MSANIDEVTQKSALETGMDDFCPKPFSYIEFEKIIRKNLHKIIINT